MITTKSVTGESLTDTSITECDPGGNVSTVLMFVH